MGVDGRKTYLILIVAFIAILAQSCGGRPENVLSDAKMSNLLADIHVAEAYSRRPGSGFVSDSSRKVLRQSVLEANGVTEKEFQASLDWYGHNMDRYTKLYDKVEENIRRRMGQQSSIENEDKNSTDIWPLSRMITIAPNDYASGFSFSLPTSGVQPGTILEWRMKLSGLNGSSTIFLGVDYDGMLSDYVIKHASDGSDATLTLKVDSVLSPQRIFGYLHLSSRPSKIVWADSLRLLSRLPGKGIPEGGGGSRQRRFRIPDKKVSPEIVNPSDSAIKKGIAR